MYRNKFVVFIVSLLLSMFSTSLIAGTQVLPQFSGPQEYIETQDDNGQSLILKIMPSTVTSTASCIYISNTIYGGPTAIGTAVVAFGPYSTNCSGIHSGNLTNLSSAYLQLTLQQLVSGTWVNRASGYISYSGTPGTYRFVVTNQPTSPSAGTWKLDYRVPI